MYNFLKEIEISNLFFCFRWLLVWFKREFEWEDVIELWEILWTNYLTDKMILFITLAVIDTHRNKLLNELNQFDDVLRVRCIHGLVYIWTNIFLQYINDLTGHIDLRRTLERAEVLFYQFERKVRAMQHKSNQLRERLEVRSVWNSPERGILQTDMEKLQIPDHLLDLLPKNTF